MYVIKCFSFYKNQMLYKLLKMILINNYKRQK